MLMRVPLLDETADGLTPATPADEILYQKTRRGLGLGPLPLDLAFTSLRTGQRALAGSLGGSRHGLRFSEEARLHFVAYLPQQDRRTEELGSERPELRLRLHLANQPVRIHFRADQLQEPGGRLERIAPASASPLQEQHDIPLEADLPLLRPRVEHRLADEEETCHHPSRRCNTHPPAAKRRVETRS